MIIAPSNMAIEIDHVEVNAIGLGWLNMPIVPTGSARQLSLLLCAPSWLISAAACLEVENVETRRFH